MDSNSSGRVIYKKFNLAIISLSINFYLILSGKVGDWKNHFSEEMNEKINKWIEKNLEGTDLKFVTELEVQD